jgi:hypothetical protein
MQEAQGHYLGIHIATANTTRLIEYAVPRGCSSGEVSSTAPEDPRKASFRQVSTILRTTRIALRRGGSTEVG